MTILEILIQSIQKAGTYNKHVQAAPVCILWPDRERQWEAIIPTLRIHLPQLLSLGKFDPQNKTGPAIWLKCMIARKLPEADWPLESIPFVYLPGFGRVDLRAIETCPRKLQPLAELQYRGVFWSQRNGKDWTLFAFLKTKDGGVGLDIAQDDKTIEADSGAPVLDINHPGRAAAAQGGGIGFPVPFRAGGFRAIKSAVEGDRIARRS